MLDDEFIYEPDFERVLIIRDELVFELETDEEEE